MAQVFYLSWTVLLDSPDRLPLRLGTAPQKKGEATGGQTPAHSPQFNTGVFIEAGISIRTVHAVAVTPPRQSSGINALAARQVANVKAAGLSSASGGGGLIQTTSGWHKQYIDHGPYFP